MVKPFSMLSLKLQKRTSMWLGTNCSTGDTRKRSKQDIDRKLSQTKVKQQFVYLFIFFTCVDLIFTIWCGPVGRHWQEAVAKLSQSVDDRYGCVHNWARHCPEQQLWWGVHNLRGQSNITQYRQITHNCLFTVTCITQAAEIRQAWRSEYDFPFNRLARNHSAWNVYPQYFTYKRGQTLVLLSCWGI